MCLFVGVSRERKIWCYKRATLRPWNDIISGYQTYILIYIHPNEYQAKEIVYAAAHQLVTMYSIDCLTIVRSRSFGVVSMRLGITLRVMLRVICALMQLGWVKNRRGWLLYFYKKKKHRQKSFRWVCNLDG